MRITHLPTGLVVQCQDEKSQHKNKAKAMKMLRARLLEAEQERAAGERASERRAQVGTRRSQREDPHLQLPAEPRHRSPRGLTLHQLDAVLEGDLDELLDAGPHADGGAAEAAPTVARPRPAAATAGPMLELPALDARSTSPSAGSRRARLDAECLLAHVLGCDRLRLYLEFDKPRGRERSARASASWCARARASAMPVAQLTGAREFWSLPLRVDAATC